MSRSALIEDEPFGASMEVDEEYQERSNHILSAVSSSTSIFDVEMSDSTSKRKFGDIDGDHSSSVEIEVPIALKRRAVEDAMDTDNEHSVVCVSGKNDVVDGGYEYVTDFVGSEVEGGAEIQPRQKSITRGGSSYQINQHLDSFSSDDDCDDDDDSSRCSDLTDDSNNYTGDDRCNPYFEGLDVAAVNCVGQRLNCLELCDDEPSGVSQRSHVSNARPDNSDVSNSVDRYVRRSIRIIPFSCTVYVTRSVAASLVKRTRSGRRY